MKSTQALSFACLCSLVAIAASCSGTGELGTESIGETEQAVTAEASNAAAEPIAPAVPKALNVATKKRVPPQVAKGAGVMVTFPPPVWYMEKNCGPTFFVYDQIPAGGTLTYYTTDATNSRDPVMAMLQRYSPWNSAEGPVLVSPYTQQVGFKTLSQDDDYGGSVNSRVSYHNSDTSQAYNVFVIGFLYGQGYDYGNLTVCRQINSDSPTCSSQYFGSNSWLTSSTQGMIWTTSGVDPILFGIDELENDTKPAAANGKWNDDCETTPPSGNIRDSCLLNFTGKPMWLTTLCPYGSSGSVTINR